MAKGKYKGKKTSLTRLGVKEFKNTVKNGNEDSLPDKVLLSKLFNPTIAVIDDFTEEEKSLMKDSDSDTMIEFIISTQGVDRDGDTIDVEGWVLANFHKNPVVPWAHDYGQPPVARALNTRIEEGSLKSRAMFTSKDLYPFGDMIGKMYKQKFLSAVSVGFNPTKFVFVDDSERKFGIDFLEQELLEYSAVPVPSNPEALIQARSKGIDIDPMKIYLEELLEVEEVSNKDSLEQLVKVFSTKTISLGTKPKEVEDEEGEHKDTVPATLDGQGNDSDGDTEDKNKDLENENDEDTTSLECLAKQCKGLLEGIVSEKSGIEHYKEIKESLKSHHGIDIFDYKYVDFKALKHFPEKFSFDEKTCTLIERSQKDIDTETIKSQVENIKESLSIIRSIDPDFKYEENKETVTYDFSGVDFEEKQTEDTEKEGNSDDENVVTFEGIDSVEDLKALLKDGVAKSSKVTFNKLTGKLN